MIAFMDVAVDIGTCVAKEHAAGLFGPFYEVWEAKSLCDDEPLEWWEQGLAFGDLSAQIASKLGVKWAGAVNIGITLQKVFRKAQPIFKKMDFKKVAQTADFIVSIAKKQNLRFQ